MTREPVSAAGQSKPFWYVPDAAGQFLQKKEGWLRTEENKNSQFWFIRKKINFKLEFLKDLSHLMQVFVKLSSLLICVNITEPVTNDLT